MMLWWTLSVFQKTKAIDEIILVVNAEEKIHTKGLKFSKIKKIVAGGRERQASVYNGLKALPENTGIVVIHDGARPFVSPAMIEAAIEQAKKHGAVVVGVPVKDTIKLVNPKTKTVIRTLPRDRVWAAQTPQVFKRDLIMKAYQKYGKQKVTDDAMLVEKMGKQVKMLIGSYLNLKITTPEDLLLAEAFLGKK